MSISLRLHRSSLHGISSTPARTLLATFGFIVAVSVASQAQCEAPLAEKTLFTNGIYAAGFAEVAATTIPNGSDGYRQSGVGASFGWQAFRGYGQAFTIGYGASGIENSKSMMHGPEFSLALMNNLPVTLVGTYSPSSGYFKRQNPPVGQDRYVLFTGNRFEGRVLFSVVSNIKVGLDAGFASVKVADKYTAEKTDEFNGGAYMGLCVRTTRM